MATALPFVGAGIQGIQAVTSGVQGKRAQQQAAKQQQMANRAFQGMLDTTNRITSGIEDRLGQFSNPELRDQIYLQAQGLGDTLSQNAGNAANQLGQGGGSAMARNAANRTFDFQPVQTQLESTTQAVRDSAARARNLASEQAALSQRNSMQALDAAMASRGFSRNSGAAAQGLANLQQQNALARTQLEGQLADQAANTAFQAGQLDSQNLLQQQGQQAQFNLGMNQLGAQTGLQLQQMNDQQALQRAGLLNNAATQGFNALQNTYQQNYLAPQMQLQGLLASIAGQGMATGAQGISGILGDMNQAVTDANTGAGNALGGFAKFLMNYQAPQSQTTPFGPGQFPSMPGGFNAQPGYLDWLNQGINRGP